jgi:hypothetical protein
MLLDTRPTLEATRTPGSVSDTDVVVVGIRVRGTRLGRATLAQERLFGLLMSTWLLALAGFSFWRHDDVRPMPTIGAVVIAVVAVVAPQLFRPLLKAWLKIGTLMGAISSPILLGIIFYGGALPTGLLLRLCGVDPLKRRREPTAGTYWIKRPPEYSSMKNQF